MSDAEHLILRAQQELRAAIETSDDRVRQAHLELADAYSLRLSAMRAQEHRSNKTPMSGPCSVIGQKDQESMVLQL